MAITSVNTSGSSYVEWGAVFAGAVIACAVSVVFVQFVGAIGLSSAEALRYMGDNRMWKVIAVSAWILFVQVASSCLGGYLTGRMRAPIGDATEHEREVRDGVHGLLVWATSTLLIVMALTLTTFFAAIAASHGVETPMAAVPSIDFTRKSGIIFGFITAAGSLASAVVAWWMGTVGGEHRDKSVDGSRYISFRKRIKA